MWSAETVVVCALALLGRSEQRFPPVQFVEKVPAGVSQLAEGYARYTEPRIVLVTSTWAFAKARMARDRCGEVEAIREIAGVLAHEEWHVIHGPDEQGAYDAQLIALVYVGARQDGALYHRVMQSKLVVRHASKRAADAPALARGATRDGLDRLVTAAPGRGRDSP